MKVIKISRTVLEEYYFYFDDDHEITQEDKEIAEEEIWNKLPDDTTQTDYEFEMYDEDTGNYISK